MVTALCYGRYGDPRSSIELREVALPEPEAGSAVVRMISCPINPSDLIPITGAYSHRISLPQVCGYEGLGVVEQVDESAGLKRGDRVLVTKHSGTWSQSVVVDSAKLVAVPDSLPDAVAARGYINPVTCALLLKKYPVQGKRLLITGGGSTCALLLSQMARLQGAEAITVVHRQSRAKAVYEDLGVQQLSSDRTKDLENAGSSADVTFDCVGGDLANHLLAVSGSSARFVSYGLLSGVPPDDRAFASKIERFSLKHEQGKYSSDWRPLFDTIWPLLAAFKLPETKPFPVHDFKNALEYFYSERDCKPVLEWRPV